MGFKILYGTRYIDELTLIEILDTYLPNDTENSKTDTIKVIIELLDAGCI